MRIEAKILQDYIQKVSLNSTIMTLNLNFSETGLTTSVSGPSNIVMVIGELKKEAFKEYESFGEIFIKNSKLFLDIIKTFNDTIDINKINDYTLKLATDKRETYTLLADEKICENIYRKDKPKIDTTVSIGLTKAFMTKTIKDMKLLGTTIVYISKENENIMFQVGKEDEYDYTKNMIKCPGEGSAKVGIGDSIIPFIESVTDGFTLSFGADMPIVLDEVTKYSTITTYIAPIIEGDE